MISLTTLAHLRGQPRELPFELFLTPASKTDAPVKNSFDVCSPEAGFILKDAFHSVKHPPPCPRFPDVRGVHAAMPGKLHSTALRFRSRADSLIISEMR
ncbi:MAG TPA: hypothetical protein VGB76_04935 [Pyrinomonadaceae bacterium]|jgi:hypothetical protein